MAMKPLAPSPLAAMLLVTTLATAGSLSADPASEPVPPVDRAVVAHRSGLDEPTLTLIEVSSHQRQQLDHALSQFIRRERPRLLTYRAIWAEMRERQINLVVSAAENAFDPCEFVSDEAMETAQAAVREARDRFDAFCATANEPVSSVLEPWQFDLVRNASTNPLLPAPLRWLALDDPMRRDLLRLVQVHEARRNLAERYPHLRDRFDEANLVRQARQILDEMTEQQLDEILVMLQTAGPPNAEESQR